jgi:hypothetical protein
MIQVWREIDLSLTFPKIGVRCEMEQVLVPSAGGARLALAPPTTSRTPSLTLSNERTTGHEGLHPHSFSFLSPELRLRSTSPHHYQSVRLSHLPHPSSFSLNPHLGQVIPLSYRLPLTLLVNL